MMITKILAGLSLGAIAMASAPEQIDAAFHTGYIPDGFDTNDNVQIVGEGMFPNSCYRPAGVEVKVDHANKTVAVKPSAYVYDGFCLQMIVPFHQVLSLGLLKTGTYLVKQGVDEKLGALKVRVATNSGPDDFLYAPINQAYVTKAEGQTKLLVSGEFTNSCMRLVDVATEVQNNVIVVLPVAEMEFGTDCQAGNFPFERIKTLSNVNSGRYLLHVRSMNGQSVNNLIDVR